MASRLATKTLLKIAETLEKRKERREERKSKNNSTTTVDAGIGNYTSTSTGVTVGGTNPSQSTPSSIGTSTSSSSSSGRGGGKKSTLLTPTSGATANQTSTAQPTPTAREVLISGKTGRPSGRTQPVYLPGQVYRYTRVGETGVPVETYYEVQTVGESRILSEEEVRKYNPPEVQLGEDKTELQRQIGETTGKIKKELQEKKEELQTEFEPTKYFVGKVEDWGSKGGNVRKAVSETVIGIIPKTTGEIYSTGALIGVGSVLGTVFKGGSTLLRTVPRAGKYLGTTYDVGLGAYGLYETERYASNVYSQIKTTNSYEPLGKGIREYSAMGIGFKKGFKTGDSWTTKYEKRITSPMENPNIAFERIKVLETPEGTKKISQVIQVQEVKPAEIIIENTKLRDKLKLKPKITSEPAELRYLVSEPAELGSKKPLVYSEFKEGRNFFNIYGVGSRSKYLGEVNNVRFDLGLTETTKALRISRKGNTINIKTPLVSGFQGFKKNLAFDMPITKSKVIIDKLDYTVRKGETIFGNNRIKTTSFEFRDIEPGYNYFSHGTTKSKLKSIKKEGLLPSSETGLSQGLSNKDLVSLGLTKESVEGFAKRAALKSRLKGTDDEPVILRVKVKEGEFESGIGKSGIDEVRVKKVESKNIQILEDNPEVINLPLLNIKVPNKKTTLLVEEKTTNNLLPLMVGGTGVTTSLYAGEGLYERTESTSVMKLPSFNEEIKIENIKVTQDIKPIESEITKSKSKGKSRTLEITKPVELTKIDEIIKPIFKEKQLPIQKEKFGQLQVQRLAQALKQVQKSKTQLSIPKVNIVLPTKLQKLGITKMKKSGTEFEAVGFRFGKPVSLGKFEEKRVASKELKEFLSSTLGASGYLKFGEKKLKAEETGLLEEFGFRKSKTGNKFLVVEEKPLRLRRGTTGKDIQFFR